MSVLAASISADWASRFFSSSSNSRAFSIAIAVARLRCCERSAWHLTTMPVGTCVPQIAIAWLLGRPTVSPVIIGARTEAQLRDNLGAIGWSLSAEQVAQLDAASDVMPAYPYYPYRTHEAFSRLNPPAI
jgi:hypothetical protein